MPRLDKFTKTRENDRQLGIEAFLGKLNGLVAVYGEAGSGKTLLCIAAAIASLRGGKKAVYIDPKKNFAVERMMQLGQMQQDILQNLLVISPGSFKEQLSLIESLRNTIDSRFGAIIVDPLTAYYRLEFAAKKRKAYLIARDLGLQLTFLAQIARKSGSPSIFTSELVGKPFSRIKELPENTQGNIVGSAQQPDEAVMAGFRLINYMSDYVIRIAKLKGSKRMLSIEKPEKNRADYLLTISSGSVSIELL